MSNWMGVPGAISSSVSVTPTVALGMSLALSISELVRFWLAYKTERKNEYIYSQSSDHLLNADVTFKNDLCSST